MSFKLNFINPVFFVNEIYIENDIFNLESF